MFACTRRKKPYFDREREREKKNKQHKRFELLQMGNPNKKLNLFRSFFFTLKYYFSFKLSTCIGMAKNMNCDIFIRVRHSSFESNRIESNSAKYRGICPKIIALNWLTNTDSQKYRDTHQSQPRTNKEREIEEPSTKSVWRMRWMWLLWVHYS